MMIFIVVLLGGAVTGGLTHRVLTSIHHGKQTRQKIDSQNIALARDMLADYMLVRSARPFNVARPGGSPIIPRLLMLPCPDNLGDRNLDGSQDPTCGGDIEGVTNGILISGSRFGRLPYRARFLSGGHGEVSDGLGADLRDSHGNRFWYAVSKNMVPTSDNTPLNFHRLDSVSSGWLSVVNIMPHTEKRVTLSERVAAVVISPGKYRVGRLPESYVTTATLSFDDILPESYFESAFGESNADSDGVFFDVFGNPSVNDRLAHIELDELYRGEFMRRYAEYAGVTQTHNAPVPDSPLDEIHRAITAWRDFFGYYPAPAANTTAHTQSRVRHCASFHATAGSGDVSPGVAMLTPAMMTVNASDVSAATITLSTNAALLAAHATTLDVLLPHEAVIGDNSYIINTPVLARYARLTLSVGTALRVPEGALHAVKEEMRLSAGITVSIVAATSVTFADKTPLAPNGMLQGWLPEHDRKEAVVSKDGAQLKLPSPIVAGFLGDALITTATRIVSLNARSQLRISSWLQIEEDFSQVKFPDMELRTDDKTQTLSAADTYKPSRGDFFRRHFAAMLLSDITYGANIIQAPKIIYPWKKKTNIAAASRDNLHNYPPCFDSRHLSRQAKTFIEDHNLYYAVASGCHYGAPETCGQTGLTVSLHPGAKMILSNPLTLSQTHTATLFGGGTPPQTLTLNHGAPPRDATAPSGVILSAGKEPTGEIRVMESFTFQKDKPVVIPAGAEIIAGGGVDIQDVEALLIFSPHPLDNTRCIIEMSEHEVVGTIHIAHQGGAGANLTRLCQWLDDDENADGDSSFIAHPPSNSPPSTNDFFMFFGGRVRFN